MNQLASLCLAVNLVYAQAAVARESWFGVDKLKHFFISAFVESVTFSVFQAAGANRRTALTGAIGVTVAVGIARETYDRRTKKVFSLRDLTWDAAGAAAAAVMLSRTVK